MNKKQDRNDSIYINRELSWLRFNERVLLQADADEVPLLERMRFCAIFTSNYDEFFMVRAGSLHDRSLLPDVPPDNKTGMTAAEQLSLLYAEAERLYKKRDSIYARLCQDLAKAGVEQLAWDDLSKDEKKLARQFFKKEIAPLTTPYIIDSRHPFPHLVNKQTHVLLCLKPEDGKSEEKSSRERIVYGIVPLPKEARLYCQLTSDGENSRIVALRYITTEEIMLRMAGELFKKYTVKSCILFKVTRNADIEIVDNFSDDPEQNLDYPGYLKILLKKREKLAPVRLEYLCKKKEETSRLLRFLGGKLGLTKEQIFRTSAPLTFDFASPLIKAASKLLPDAVYQPIPSLSLSIEGAVMEHLRKSDILMNYPYHSMRTYLAFLREAVDDDAVTSIKITLYRLSSQSEVISLLRAAADKGKIVTTVVELKARFDEANNIHWAECLEEAGCRVIYGMPGLKVHSKVTLVTRKCENGFEQFAHIGTGNYNEQTAKLYTDIGILTADPTICADVDALFRNLSTGVTNDEYEKLLVSPTCLKPRILAEIAAETEAAKAGKRAYIRMKMNSMTDKDIIDALAKASQAGVYVDLIIRGICCLRAGVPGMTDNIRVTSIVGRYLEHSRIFIFGNIDGDVTATPPRVYIGSADMMTRNTTRRIEVITPVNDPQAARTLIELTELELRDNVKASEMLPDGTYKKKESAGEPVDSQIELYKLYSK